METLTKDLLLWGHSYDEYLHMFDLTDADLRKSIIDYASGCACFNAHMYQLGKRVISVDVLYSLSPQAIEQEIKRAFSEMYKQVNEMKEQFLWEQVGSEEAWEKKHHACVQQFLSDFRRGKEEGRYRADSLTAMDFPDYSFQLGLCSHFLFATNQLTLEFHVEAIKEMCRVADELRIFPLLNAEGELSTMLGEVMMMLQQQNYGVEIKEVNYEFQRGGNAMLKVWSLGCPVNKK